MNKVTPTGRGWMCPNEAWEILIEQGENGGRCRSTCCRSVSRSASKLTVRNGEVTTTLGGQVFHYRIADNPLRLVTLNGRTVELAYDPLDMGEAAIYCESRFFGLARCVELRRMGEHAVRRGRDGPARGAAGDQARDRNGANLSTGADAGRAPGAATGSSAPAVDRGAGGSAGASAGERAEARPPRVKSRRSGSTRRPRLSG